MKYSKAVLLLLTIVTVFTSEYSYSQTSDTLNLNSLIFSRQFKTDTVSSKYKTELIEKLKTTNVLSGTVRFSGAGFPQVASFPFRIGSPNSIISFLERCQLGSRITFEDCIFKNKDGKNVGPINKSILIH